jgi:hypothetical protein
MKLAKTMIEQAPPRATSYRLNDSIVPGLCLLVLPSGVKTFYLRFRTMDGQQREMKLGRPTELTPDDARRLAREALALVREGKDPAHERRQLRGAKNLEELSAAYKTAHGDKKRSAANDDGYWRNHLLPGLGRSTKVVSLTTEAIREWHQQHPKPITANRALEVLSKAFDLAEGWGWRAKGTNPCEGIVAHAERKRRRYLTSDELSRLRAALAEWELLGGLGSIRWRFAQLVRLLLLTGARLRNIMEARWSWIDWDRALLVIPPEHHKTGGDTQDDLTVHLPPRAVEILLELRRCQNQASPWVIAGAKDGKPLVGYRKFWLALLSEAQIHNLRIHDLRHSFASYVLSSGHGLGVVGQLLGHQSTQTTARYAHLIDEAAKAAVAGVGSRLEM